MPTDLSNEERAVLRELGRGRTTDQIARRLGIAESTVIWYVSRAVSRYGPRRTEQLAFMLARGARRRALALIVAVGLMLLLGIAIVSATHAFGIGLDFRTPVPTARPSASPSLVPTASAGSGGAAPTARPTTGPPADATAPPLLTSTPMPIVPVVPLPTIPLATALPSPLPLPSLPLPSLPVPTPGVPRLP